MHWTNLEGFNVTEDMKDSDDIRQAMQRGAVSPTGRVRVMVSCGIDAHVVRLLRANLAEQGYDVLQVERAPHHLNEADFAALEKRVIEYAYKRTIGAPAIEDFEDTSRTARRARERSNKRKAQRRARTGRK